MKKMPRVLTLILALAICFTCIAMSTFAGDEDTNLVLANDTTPTPTPTPTATPTPNPTTSPTTQPSSSPAAAAAAAAPARVNAKFVADVSGKYRTSMAKIMATVDPVAVAEQELVIDPVTNTIGNLYDSEGNLIPCTLSSDGHFYIIPTNDGYAYIPTGK